MIPGEDVPDGQEKSRNRQLVIDSGALLTSSPVKKIVAEQLDSKNAKKAATKPTVKRDRKDTKNNSGSSTKPAPTRKGITKKAVKQ